MNLDLDRFKNTPIKFTFQQPSTSFLDQAKLHVQPFELSSENGLLIDNRYFKDGIKGSFQKVYVREFIKHKLQEAINILSPDYGFVVFDGYRSKEAQAGLFDSYFNQIRSKNPQFTEEQLHIETRKYVAHPDEPSRFEVPPHNSGGAIDLGLTYKGQPADMGTDFDDLTERAATDFFERDFDAASGFTTKQWSSIKSHRRILFHSLVGAGFTNWKHEWWHFDIGNSVWSQELKIPSIYGSMDKDFRNL